MNKNDVTNSAGVMSYEAIQAQGQAALRRAILDEATRLLVEEGLRGLSLRRIAGAVGCSTTVLYTLFGGKNGIVEALWLEGFARLWQAEERAERGQDPLARLAALGGAYRTHALENPDYYRVMFGGAVPGFRPSERALDLSRETFRVLVDAARDCIEAGLFRPEDPEVVASVLWTVVHGAVSLQLNGAFQEPGARAIFERAMRAAAEGFLICDLAPGAEASGP